MSEPLVLSLFPGIGLLDMAFEEEGFCVVRGPDLLWGGDIRRFHPPAGKFDGVIGGPPCQIFSRLRHVNPKCREKIGNLIPEFVRCVNEARPTWFVMENVPDAPEPDPEGYAVRSELVRDVWVGGVTPRLRRISTGGLDGFHIETLALHMTEPGLPADFDLPPFKVSAKVKAIGNGVPLPMGRAIAKAVKRVLLREEVGR